MPTTKVVDLPVHTKIGQVIASVHGGPIFSAVMCDTVALISLMTALVTFVELQVARNFVEAAGTDGFYIGSKRDEVQLIRSSTHPINPAMYRLIRFHGPSRILAISSPGKDKALNNIIYAALSRSSVLTQLSLAARFLSVMWICASH
ncbi:hypothetical protein N7449_001138 [Penicillium cf. viridicatum]|uniref:Uncharacterized protein n=1 Tax=Penicillium cf. viridicatum TaxID=2972119 RepID=A0A9W9N7G3_9EURO|nr:hypothetical protein N7449_001138 [Penicillium cf. viridicatum]